MWVFFFFFFQEKWVFILLGVECQSSFAGPLGFISVCPPFSLSYSHLGLIELVFTCCSCAKLLAVPSSQKTHYTTTTLKSGPCSDMTLLERHTLLILSEWLCFYSPYFSCCVHLSPSLLVIDIVLNVCMFTWWLPIAVEPTPSVSGDSQQFCSLFQLLSSSPWFIFRSHRCHSNHKYITILFPLIVQNLLRMILLYFTAFEFPPAALTAEISWDFTCFDTCIR